MDADNRQCLAECIIADGMTLICTLDHDHDGNHFMNCDFWWDDGACDDEEEKIRFRKKPLN